MEEIKKLNNIIKEMRKFLMSMDEDELYINTMEVRIFLLKWHAELLSFGTYDLEDEWTSKQNYKKE